MGYRFRLLSYPYLRSVAWWASWGLIVVGAVVLAYFIGGIGWEFSPLFKALFL